MNHVAEVQALVTTIGTPEHRLDLIGDLAHAFRLLMEHGDPASEVVRKRSLLLAIRLIQEGLRRQLDDAQRLIDFMGNGGGFKADL